MTFEFVEHEVSVQKYPVIRKNDSGMIVLFVNDHQGIVLKRVNSIYEIGEFAKNISINHFSTQVHGTLTF